MTETTTYETDAQPGDLVFDLAQEHAPLIVTERCGPVADLDESARDLLATAHGNQVIGYDDETLCVKAVFASLDSEPSREYLFPATRLRRPRVEHAALGTAAEIAYADLLRALLTRAYLTTGYCADDVLHLAEMAGIDDEVATYANDMAKLDAGVDI